MEEMRKSRKSLKASLLTINDRHRSIEWSGRRILAREGMPLDYRKNIYVISSARNPIPWVANKVCEVRRNI